MYALSKCRKFDSWLLSEKDFSPEEVYRHHLKKNPPEIQEDTFKIGHIKDVVKKIFDKPAQATICGIKFFITLREISQVYIKGGVRKFCFSGSFVRTLLNHDKAGDIDFSMDAGNLDRLALHTSFLELCLEKIRKVDPAFRINKASEVLGFIHVKLLKNFWNYTPERDGLNVNKYTMFTLVTDLFSLDVLTIQELILPSIFSYDRGRVNVSDYLLKDEDPVFEPQGLEGLRTLNSWKTKELEPNNISLMDELVWVKTLLLMTKGCIPCFKFLKDITGVALNPTLHRSKKPKMIDEIIEAGLRGAKTEVRRILFLFHAYQSLAGRIDLAPVSKKFYGISFSSTPSTPVEKFLFMLTRITNDFSAEYPRLVHAITWTLLSCVKLPEGISITFQHGWLKLGLDWKETRYWMVIPYCPDLKPQHNEFFNFFGLSPDFDYEPLIKTRILDRISLLLKQKNGEELLEILLSIDYQEDCVFEAALWVVRNHKSCELEMKILGQAKMISQGIWEDHFNQISKLDAFSEKLLDKIDYRPSLLIVKHFLSHGTINWVDSAAFYTYMKKHLNQEEREGLLLKHAQLFSDEAWKIIFDELAENDANFLGAKLLDLIPFRHERYILKYYLEKGFVKWALPSDIYAYICKYPPLPHLILTFLNQYPEFSAIPLLPHLTSEDREGIFKQNCLLSLKKEFLAPLNVWLKSSHFEHHDEYLLRLKLEGYEVEGESEFLQQAPSPSLGELEGYLKNTLFPLPYEHLKMMIKPFPLVFMNRLIMAYLGENDLSQKSLPSIYSEGCENFPFSLSCRYSEFLKALLNNYMEAPTLSAEDLNLVFGWLLLAIELFDDGSLVPILKNWSELPICEDKLYGRHWRHAHLEIFTFLNRRPHPLNAVHYNIYLKAGLPASNYKPAISNEIKQECVNTLLTKLFRANQEKYFIHFLSIVGELKRLDLTLDILGQFQALARNSDDPVNLIEILFYAFKEKFTVEFFFKFHAMAIETYSTLKEKEQLKCLGVLIQILKFGHSRNLYENKMCNEVFLATVRIFLSYLKGKHYEEIFSVYFSSLCSIYRKSPSEEIVTLYLMPIRHALDVMIFKKNCALV